MHYKDLYMVILNDSLNLPILSAVSCADFFLYGPLLNPFLRSFLGESTQVSVMPSLMHR
ncbi:hypothetical protein BD408DRAFT_184326 [Parasitella parasitica]|nr:hypothetical protein BD408DRAFT_184326 [Parasitella parasitica]